MYQKYQWIKFTKRAYNWTNNANWNCSHQKQHEISFMFIDKFANADIGNTWNFNNYISNEVEN